MSNSNAIVRYVSLATIMKNVAPKVQTLVKPKPAIGLVYSSIDPEVANRFRMFRPEFYTATGRTMCSLHKVDISPRTGETVAYYDLRMFDEGLLRWGTVRYLYGMRNGVPKELKKFPIRYDR